LTGTHDLLQVPPAPGEDLHPFTRGPKHASLLVRLLVALRYLLAKLIERRS
jgi:hypothetical protein